LNLRAAAAEEPVTAHIRRRIHPPADSDLSAMPDEQAVLSASEVMAEPKPAAIAAPVGPPAIAVPPASTRPKTTYRERVTRDKPRNARRMSLF
jgi:hypothetical protein